MWRKNFPLDFWANRVEKKILLYKSTLLNTFAQKIESSKSNRFRDMTYNIQHPPLYIFIASHISKTATPKAITLQGKSIQKDRFIQQNFFPNPIDPKI